MRRFPHNYLRSMLLPAIILSAGLAAGCSDSGTKTDSLSLSFATIDKSASSGTGSQYALANAYFKIKALSNGKYLLGNSAGYEAQAAADSTAMTFYMKPSALGTYIFYDSDGKWLNINWFGAIVRNTDRQTSIQWVIAPQSDGFSIYSVTKKKYVSISGTSLIFKSAVDSSCLFSFVSAAGTKPFPEADLNLTITAEDGSAVAPENAMARPAVGEMITGYADTHAHLNHFLGSGQVTFVMETFNPLGIQEALNSCAGWHGNGGALDLWGLAVDGHFGHPTDGYPDFPFWPTSYSTNHQQTYYKWLERSWLAGQRVFVQQMVSNQTLAEFMNTMPPYKNAPTDDMVIADLQIQNIYDMQDYIDAQCGGPGKGWFRVCRNSTEARTVISQGKMAVFLSLEFDTVFGAGADYISQYEAGTITKTELDAKLALIRAQLDKYYAKGVRSVFPVHAFNSGFGGSQLYQGVIFNVINKLNRGDFFEVIASPNPRVYYTESNTDLPAGATGHANKLGLTKLGAWLIDELIARKFIIEIDHMSDRTFNAALDQIWSAKYPGIIASHTRILDMYTPDKKAWEQIDIPRMIKVMQLGGIVSPMLWETIDRHQKCVTDYLAFMIEISKAKKPCWGILNNPEYFRYGGPYKVPTSWYNTNSDTGDDLIFGVPYGSDVNGACMLPNFDANTTYGSVNYDDGSFGALYPGIYNSGVDTSKVRFDRQKTGNRTFDINGDRGVAHYGLIPDLIKKLQTQPDSVNMDATFHSAEAYIRMMERVERYGAAYPSRNADDWPVVDTEYWH